MSFKALVYAYVIGGVTFIPLLIISLIAYTLYTSVPVGDSGATEPAREKVELPDSSAAETDEPTPLDPSLDLNDLPKTRRAWLTVRRTFQEVAFDGSYVTLMKSFLDSRSKDPKRSRPRDMWYVVLKGKVLYLYEDEAMTECEAVIELGSHSVLIYPEDLPDGELFTKRNAICLKPRPEKAMPSVSREMQLSSQNVDEKAEERGGNNSKKKQKEKERLIEHERQRDLAREEASDPSTPWFIFMRSSVEMEDWYFSLIHASNNPANSSTLTPLQAIFSPVDMSHLVSTLDEQPDIIPMRWLNALLGRIFFSYYNTDALESYIIGRLMKKLAKVKRPHILSEIVVTEANMGNKPVMFSKPMLKELTKEGDAALEMRVQYKGEMRITIKAVATISLGFKKPYAVKLVLAVVLRELEGNLVVRVKRTPSNRIWYAFTHMPKMVLNVEPVVSDRQLTWGMILNTIESKLKEIILESIVLPNMDDIAFFDSSSYSHRGGIWPDAGRREKPNASHMPSVDDDVSTVSAPPDVDSSSLISGDVESEVKRSSSEGDVNVTTDPRPTSPLSHNRSATSPPSRGPSPAPDPSHRHLFNSREHHPPVEDPDSSTEAALLEVQHHPLRHKSSSSSEKSKRRFLGIRRASPSPSLGVGFSSHELSPTPSLENLRTLSPEPPNHAGPLPDARPTKSPVPSSSHSSLLSTLKSRAADRQALSNSARETVRKWTVNWGGLKKDRDSSMASSSSTQDGRDNSPRSTSQTVKSSYAEIRAAVDERKEKEQRSSEVPSAPILPDRGHKGRSGSVSSMHNPESSSVSSSPTDSSMVLPSSAGWSADPWVDETSPELASQRPPVIDIDGTQLDSEDINGEGPAPTMTVFPPPPLPQRPIQSQPSQGKTMTIPGIHVRNRGEVMSMGYVPPSPPAPEAKAGVSGVYRLWKSSSVSQSEQPDGNEDTEHAGLHSPPVLTADSAETPPEPTPMTTARPPAPPLPPRTPSSLHPIPNDSTRLPPASAALKSIASRDEECRVQDGENIEALSSPPVSPKPPLPPRKIQAPAY